MSAEWLFQATSQRNCLFALVSSTPRVTVDYIMYLCMFASLSQTVQVHENILLIDVYTPDMHDMLVHGRLGMVGMDVVLISCMLIGTFRLWMCFSECGIFTAVLHAGPGFHWQ